MPVPVRHAVGRVHSGPASPIQSAALAHAASGTDLLAVAPTGSGKTLVLALAAAVRLAGAPSAPGRPSALLVAPTRELAAQVTDVLDGIGSAAGLRVATVAGGVPVARDRRSLVGRVDVLVGTPGRLNDLRRTRDIDLSGVRLVELDEVDHLLAPAFAEQVRTLLSAVPLSSGLVATTATADERTESELRSRWSALTVVRVAEGVPSPGSGDANPAVSVLLVVDPDPERAVVGLSTRFRRALVFVARRDLTGPLAEAVADQGVSALAVHGSASPTRRTEAFASLASGRVRVLVTTDLAGRGLDIPDIGHIVHVGPPHSPEDLIHRSGRTGRGGREPGIVLVVAAPSDVPRVRRLADQAGVRLVEVDPTSSAADEALGDAVSAPPRSPRRRTAPAERSRRPAVSRPHRPKRGRGGHG